VAAVAELDESGRILVLSGAIAAEAHLLDELRASGRANADDPRLLRRPVLVIVPSRSLREHLCARLIESHARSLAGISIQTLGGVVTSILARAGEPAESDDALLPALIRRLARREASLRESFDGLSRGYAAAVEEVSDLLDAGMIFATGFAPFRGGPMRYAQSVGVSRIADTLAAFANEYPRLAPTAALRQLAAGLSPLPPVAETQDRQTAGSHPGIA